MAISIRTDSANTASLSLGLNFGRKLPHPHLQHQVRIRFWQHCYKTHWKHSYAVPGHKPQISRNYLRSFSPVTQDLDTLRPDEVETIQGREAPSSSQLEKLCLSTKSQSSVAQTQHNSICRGQWQARRCFAEVGTPKKVWGHWEPLKIWWLSAQNKVLVWGFLLVLY